MTIERRVSRLLQGPLAPLGEALFETARTGEALRREIVQVDGRLIGFTTVPVKAGVEVVGVVCLCQDVTEVQAEQHQHTQTQSGGREHGYGHDKKKGKPGKD